MFVAFVVPVLLALLMQLLLHSAYDLDQNQLDALNDKQLIAASEAFHLLSNSRDRDQNLLQVRDRRQCNTLLSHLLFVES